MSDSSRQGDRLAELIRSGDTEALARELYPLVRGMVCRAVGSLDRDLVTTATTEAVLAICRHTGSFRGEAKATTWVYRIARREAIRRARREKAHRAACGPDGAEPAPDRRAGHPANLSRDEALAALGLHVPNPDWRLIWLLWNEPGRLRTHEDVAALTGYTPGSIAVVLSRVRRRLNGAGDDEPGLERRTRGACSD